MAYAQMQMQDAGPTLPEFLMDVSIQMSFTFIARALKAPTNRMVVLAAVEGELKKQKRIGATGFGGILGIAGQMYSKEGVMSFFRGLLTDAVLTIPSTIAEEIATSCVSSVVFRFLSEERVDSLPAVVVITISLLSTSAAVLLATPVTNIQTTVTTNYMADIVAPLPQETKQNSASVGGEESTATVDEKTVTIPENSGDDGENNNNEEVEEGYHYANSRETFSDIKRRNGWRGFYRGVGIDALAVFAYRGLYYYTLRLVSEEMQAAYPNAIARTLAFAAGIITQPFDVISRRMMLSASAPGNSGYKNMWQCAKTIVNEEGCSALWSGLKLRLLVTGVGIALVDLRYFLS